MFGIFHFHYISFENINQEHNLMPNGNCLLSSASLLLVADNALVHELRVVAAVELHLNVTYYAQHPALKPVYEKSQYIMGDNLFFSYRTVFDIVHGL